MAITVHLAFIIWGLLALALFYLLPPRQAVLTAFISGALFLPTAGYPFPLLHDKVTIIGLGLLVCSMLFHSSLWLQFRPRWFDLPAFLWCVVSPIASGLSNQMGTYDELSSSMLNVLVWGVPYILGRLYFSSLQGLRELAIGLLVGVLAYAPFCLWEIRLSPQLHNDLYGFFQHDFSGHARYGGWRPIVFMKHGLMVALWMAAGTLQGVWLWRSGALKRLWGIPMAWIVGLLVVTVLLCKTMNGIVLLGLGTAVYFLTKSLRILIPLFILMAIPPLYMFTRSTGRWSGENLISSTQQLVNAERAESLSSRIYNENILIEKALEQKWFGWSRWGRSRVRDQWGRDLVIADGFWIITLGENGLLGLISFWTMVLLPVLILWRRCPARYWTHPKIAPAAGLAVLLVLYMMDNLLNSMGQQVFIVAAGALAGLSKRSIAWALKPPLLTSAERASLRAVGAQIATARAHRG